MTIKAFTDTKSNSTQANPQLLPFCKPWNSIPAKGPILRPPEAAAYYGVALSTYYALIRRGDVPGFIKLSKHARASGVPQAWLDAAIAAHVAA